MASRGAAAHLAAGGEEGEEGEEDDEEQDISRRDAATAADSLGSSREAAGLGGAFIFHPPFPGFGQRPRRFDAASADPTNSAAIVSRWLPDPPRGCTVNVACLLGQRRYSQREEVYLSSAPSPSEVESPGNYEQR